jgi:SAM-dependent methyltransferase
MSSTERNRDYYEAAAPAREDYWRYMAAPRARVARILDLVRRLAPHSLADLGCGNGRLLEELAHALPQAQLAGFDLASRQIEENRLRLPDMTWTVADLQAPLAPAATFDVIVASEVIEHLDDPAMLLANAHALASHGGHLVLTTQSGPLRETERRVGHVQHFDPNTMSALLARSGWTPLRVWNEGFPFHDLSKWWANRNADASMARFGGEQPYDAKTRLLCFALRTAFLCNARRRGAQLYALARKEG